MHGVLTNTCMHDWHKSIAKLNSRIDLHYPQSLCVICVGRIQLQLMSGLEHTSKAEANPTDTHKTTVHFVSLAKKLLDNNKHTQTNHK